MEEQRLAQKFPSVIICLLKFSELNDNDRICSDILESLKNIGKG